MAKILLVEDDILHRDMVNRYLTLSGHQVILASNGMQAVAMARTESPDIIVMDMGLPVLDGWQATRQIKNTPETHGIPVIALTAFALEEEEERSVAAGCDAFETKPVDFERLLAKMQTLLAGGVAR